MFFLIFLFFLAEKKLIKSASQKISTMASRSRRPSASAALLSLTKSLLLRAALVNSFSSSPQSSFHHSCHHYYAMKRDNSAPVIAGSFPPSSPSPSLRMMMHAAAATTTARFPSLRHLAAHRHRATSSNLQRQLIPTMNGGESAGMEATQWLTFSFPEGYCVGVISAAHPQQQLRPEEHEHQLGQPPQQNLLHPDEFKWGQANISSIHSRTSYYLGRIALRLALQKLLLLNQHQHSRTINQKLWEQIISNPIEKDSHGRPILPEFVLGSISHKEGECAVGLASFQSTSEGGGRGQMRMIMDGNDAIAVDDDSDDVEIRWREDCPIYYNDDDYDDDNDLSTTSNNNTSSSSSISTKKRSNIINTNQQRVGIGVDLERIDDNRGKRIQKKVLTNNERNELGGLVDKFNISIGEEVMLRFSLKESVYKAMHPILCEYVGFQEAEITPLPDGTAKVTLNLQSLSHERLGIDVRSTSWRKLDDGFFLTTALVVGGGRV